MEGFVYVIESPSSSDLLDGRTEGRALTEALVLAQIPSWYSLVTDQVTLCSAIGRDFLQHGTTGNRFQFYI